MNFYQTPPVLKNQFKHDSFLQAYLQRKFPQSQFPEAHADLDRLGQSVVSEYLELSRKAESQPPIHVPYDAWGNRIDEITVSEAWKAFEAISAKEGLVAIGYARELQEHSRVYQFLKLFLFHPSSAMYTCPLAMTDGAARVLEEQPDFKASFDHLTSRDPSSFWTSGQWMTERSGGSDVSGTETVATRTQTSFTLSGVKWFTSATTSQMAMTLAKIEGQDKLSLFYVELRDHSGRLRNIQVNRLKQKLGTHALPTAELTLLGTPAKLVGEEGKGVKTIATLFNITRIYNACSAIALMRRGMALAFEYSKVRMAFGKKLIDHPLHSKTLADLQVRYEACFLLTFYAVELLGKSECKKISPQELATLRLLIPLVKLYTAKEGVAIASEVIEAFGGAGYIEDTGLPQILRDAQVLAIWEGTTNVLSLDAQRAIFKEKSLGGFLASVKDKTKNPQVLASIDTIVAKMTAADETQLNLHARELSFALIRVLGAALLEEHYSSQSSYAPHRFVELGLLSPAFFEHDPNGFQDYINGALT
jgi:putative acyl-CoA dehydrogenase